MTTNSQKLDDLITKRWKSITKDLTECTIHHTQFCRDNEPCWKCYDECREDT